MDAAENIPAHLSAAIDALARDGDRNPLPLSAFIHDNLAIVMTFAYSKHALLDMRDRAFHGGFKYLEKAIFTIPQERASKACYELAFYLRTLDDEERLSDYFAERNLTPSCGRLFLKDAPASALTFREATNKILHSLRLEWEFTRGPDAVLICHPRPDKPRAGGKAQRTSDWYRAEVDLTDFAAVCAMFAS